MRQTLRISPIPPNLNVYRNMNKFLLGKLKIEWAAIVYNELKKQSIVPVSKPIDAVMTLYFNRKTRHDPDNYACCGKFLFDPLVTSGILKDDSFEFIQSFLVKQGGYIKGEQYLTIELIEIEKDHS